MSLLDVRLYFRSEAPAHFLALLGETGVCSGSGWTVDEALDELACEMLKRDDTLPEAAVLVHELATAAGDPVLWEDRLVGRRALSEDDALWLTCTTSSFAAPRSIASVSRRSDTTTSSRSMPSSTASSTTAAD